MSAAEPPLKNSKKPKKLVNVRLLTGHEHQTYVDVKAKFQDVFNQVAAHYGLREVEYFGLAEHKDGEYQFISNEEKVQKHAPKAWKASSGEGLDKYGKPFLTVHFRVQYFVDNAILLREKITRQLYYLQLKENVLGYRYLFSEERCFQLAAFALQTDMGIYSPSRHGTDYFDPREYFPAWVVEKRGHEYLTHHVPTMHQDLRNTTRSDAQLKFIREASLSPAAHNLHFYRLKKRKTDKVFNAWLGICPKGVEIYEDSADGFKDLISTFFWPDIGKLYFEKKKFEIRSVGSWDGRKFTYYTDSDAKSKFLLSLCRSSHMFQMSVQAKLSEIRHLDAEDKRYRESYIYSDARDLASSRAVSPARSLLSPKKAVGAGQRYSVVSNTSSNTTSGIVSDKLHISFDESEEFEDEGMSEIMIDSPPRSSMGDSPPRPNMGTPMLTTPKQGRGRLVPFSPKTPTGLDRKVKEVSRSPVRRSGSNASQGSKGSGHADLSPITSNGSYRSRLQQHQQMLQGARLQQMAIQPQPFINQGRTQSSPQSKAKRAPSPSSVSVKSQSFNLPPKSSSGTPATSSAGQVFSLPPKVPVNPLQSPAQARPRVHESPQRPVVGQGTPKLQPKALPTTLPSAAKPPIPPQQPTAEKVVEEDSTALRPVLPVDAATPQQSVPIIHQPFSTTHTIPHEVEPPANQPFAAPLMNPAQQPYSMQLPQSGLYQPYTTNQTSVPSPQGATSAQQPYTAQQVQVKQPQQFLAHQVTPGQPKVIQQYYPQQDQTAAASAVNKPASAVSQFCGQQHTSTPLQQFAQEQPVSQQQFAVPLSLPQQPKYAMPVQPAVPKQIYVAQPQPHQQFLVPVPQQQFTVVHSKSQKQYAVQPQPSGLYPSSPLNVTQPPTVYAGTTGPVYTTQPPQYLPGNTPQYTSPVIHQYQFEEQKPSKPLSKNPSRGDSFKNDLGSWQLHQKSSSAPCNRPTPLDAIVLPDLMTSEQSLVGKDSDTPSTFRMSSSADDLVSLNSSVAMAEIDKAYSSLFDGYDADYLASETEELERFNDSDDSPNASFRIGEIQPILHHSVSSTASPNTSFSYEDLEKALDQVILASQETDGATDKDREEALKAKRTRIAVKNKKEKLHPELEEIRGNVKEFSLPLITALFNDTNLLPTPGSHGSDLMYDTSTICSTDSRWSCDTDSRRLSSSYPSSTGTMISLYSASRPFSWHSEHFDLDAQLAASMRMSSRRPAALFDNARSEPRSLNEVHPNPPVASWTQAIAYGNPYGLGNGSQIDRYSPELLASQHMIPPKISSGGHTKPDSNIKTLKENVGIA